MLISSLIYASHGKYCDNNYTRDIYNSLHSVTYTSLIILTEFFLFTVPLLISSRLSLSLSLSLSLRESSELFATSSRHDVRVWHSNTSKELLRIQIPNLLCNAVEITPDGKGIITGQ